MEKWGTREGVEMLISDMDDRHLLNAHRMLCRQISSMAAYNRMRGLEPDESAEAAIGTIHNELHILAKLYKARELQEEIESRGIAVLIEIPDNDYLREIESEIERAEYEAYCSDKDVLPGNWQDYEPDTDW